MKRFMIIGQPGAGKSVFARRLGARTGLPVFHIDKIHWQSGWVERCGTQKDEMCAAVIAGDSWIFEGGRSLTWPQRLDRADTLIWLDFPLWLRSWRVVKRTLRYYGQSRPDLPENCPERFNAEFWAWIWNTRHTSRKMMRRTFDAAPKNKECHRITTKRAVNRFLKSV